MILDAIVSIGSILIPPVFDFIKKKFIKTERDTPEATMATLATTKPESLPAYTKAMSDYLLAQVSFFNRDVVGELPQWVSALRATIRPTVVVVGLIHLTASGLSGEFFTLDPGVRYFYESVIGSWFGTRMTK